MANAQVQMGDKSYLYWRGGLGVLLGILVLVWPQLTGLILVTLISIWLLVVGAITIIEGVMDIKKGGFGWLLSILLGILELGVGAYFVQRPKITALTFVSLLGLIFIVQGFVSVAKTFISRGASSGQRWLSLVFGLLSLIAGIWVWRYPLNGALVVVWLIGLYLIAAGALQIAAGVETKE